MELRIEHVKKSFGKKEVLSDICLEKENGQCVALLGENGCGKSTLLSILAGTLRADGGRILVDGVDILKDHKSRSKVLGYVPQGTPLMAELSALDNLRLWYSFCGRDLESDLKEGVPALLGVSEFLKVPVARMSGGMRKRLSISCAVAHQPKLLLMDEPSAALDLPCKEVIRDYVDHFVSEGGLVLLATHDTEDLGICGSSVILKGGKLHDFTYTGDVRELTAALRN
ncbi:MAG: ABC transporter ATP-binding protein [Lachnospiraceae bacterium]